ncbi:hypothetical protein HMN09_00466100 [Mycena chlorophos]|uniref:Uncharacterized protein n=1 Tax=Mycena chlorophos TaxID=658473 RepID=A0A8H6TIH9_MYCCL|nr:hypothetical protein HMN09_00466100 [Mycena chlorophos]
MSQHATRTGIPAIRAFAGFQLDARLSVDPILRDHPHVVAQTAVLQPTLKTYVVYVAEGEGYYQHHAPYNAAHVYFLLPHVPPADPGIGLDPRFSIPMGTAPPNSSHISGRSYLQPTRPFPWKEDTCTMEVWTATLRSPTAYDDLHNITHKLSIPEAIAHSRYIQEDYTARTSPNETVSAQVPPAPPPQARDSAEIPNDSDSESGGSSSSDEDALLLEHMFVSCDLTKNMLTGTFSHNLTNMAVLENPEDFLKEVAAIYRIEHEAADLVATAARAK